MLPILLFNNMEGSSNSLNNNPSSSFSGVYDENIILNCVRSRRKVTELPNCPVCSCTIRQGELESHLTVEVEKLNKLSTGSKRKLSLNTSPVAVAGPSSSQNQVAEDQEINVTGCTGSDVYNRVHQNRLQRLRARRRSTQETQAWTHGECPVCSTTMPLARLQRHALRCLKRTGALIDEPVPDTSSEEGSIDVENPPPSALEGTDAHGNYNWCDEWRQARAALLKDRSERRAAAAARRVETDEPLIVDEDEDTSMFGPTQYSPSRIAPDADIGEYVEEAPDESQDGEENAENEGEESASSQEEAEEPAGRSKINGMVAASAETRIQALKVKIKELEAKQNSSQMNCLVCLSPYVSPAVSIQCWHVYCEVCWLQSLKAKKICPHCNVITTTDHLRRIYM